MLGTQKRAPKAGVVLLLRAEEIFPNPNQPRRSFDAAELEGLAESIRQNGILQPLTVRKLPGGGYELIAGERRLRAARLVGLPRIPCLLSEASDEASAVLALVENLQRQDLDCFEEAEAIQKLMELCGVAQEQMARMLGKAPSTLSNKLRLLRLPHPMRQRMAEAGLTERHARSLLRLESEEQQVRALAVILSKSLNVSETEALVDALCGEAAVPIPKKTHTPSIRLVRDVRLFVNTINHAVEVMRQSGIPAESEVSDSGDFMEYTIRIPKQAAVKPPAQRKVG
ncbi:MAG: ParB/RepB/Spo0J family partition protein [Oscillospiraceae bacterium]|nr:ParB/RepB/Spo0J family partition protein [Oscillospiraceae bacterium]